MLRKMATLGSELSANVVEDISTPEDEADSDSAAEFIDPDSDCSENPPVQKKRKTSNRPKKASVCKFKRSWSLPQHTTSRSQGDTAAFVQATFLFRMAGLTTSNGMYQDLYISRQKDSCGTSTIATFFQTEQITN